MVASADQVHAGPSRSGSRLQLVRRQEAGAGVGRLLAEHAVELGGVAARLVDLQGQLRRVEDDRAAAGRQDGRGQERHRLLRQAGGPLHEVERADVLVAAGTVPAGFRVAAPLHVVGIGGLHLQPGPHVRDDLVGGGAIRGLERLPLAEGVVVGLRGGHADHAGHGPSAPSRRSTVRSMGTSKGSLQDGGLVALHGGTTVVEPHRQTCVASRGAPMRTATRPRHPPTPRRCVPSWRSPTRRRRGRARRSPPSSPRLRPSTWPDLMVASCSRRRTNRTSA